ncbi:MAG: SRPBCC family protein [Actinobacteria bacterium]|nr:SRPBCC family protein [Actinomycetota bacterium]NBY15274.1 SRPBCC family protein [Actinomycetota bacterium]
MTHLELRVDIQAPVDEVWRAITEWNQQGKWMLATKVESLDGQGRHVGARIKAVTGFGPLGILDTMTITHWDPPNYCAVLHTGKIVRGTGEFQVKPIHDQAATFIWAEDLDIPLGLLGKVGFLLIRPLFLLGIKHSLVKFANLVEQGKI